MKLFGQNTKSLSLNIYIIKNSDFSNKKTEFASSFCLISIQIERGWGGADYVSPSPHMPDCVTAKCPRDGGLEEGSGSRGRCWGAE